MQDKAPDSSPSQKQDLSPEPESEPEPDPVPSQMQNPLPAESLPPDPDQDPSQRQDPLPAESLLQDPYPDPDPDPVQGLNQRQDAVLEPVIASLIPDDPVSVSQFRLQNIFLLAESLQGFIGLGHVIRDACRISYPFSGDLRCRIGAISSNRHDSPVSVHLVRPDARL